MYYNFTYVALVAFICLIMPLSSWAQKKGSFVDSRDGQRYRTVLIGNQTWMAQDLNYKSEEGSWCYENRDDCSHRLYNWKAATESCPAGWHLPSEEEWLNLIEQVGGDQVAGTKLKDRKGWRESETEGDNSSGFSARPGGYRNHGAVFGGEDTEGYWWSSTELGGGAWYFCLRFDTPVIKKYGSNHKGGGFSVRCVKD